MVRLPLTCYKKGKIPFFIVTFFFVTYNCITNPSV